MRISLWVGWAAALGIVATGCSSPTSADGAVTLATETFTGTVQQGSFDAHQFTATHDGALTVTLTSTAPLAAITMGIGLSAYTGGACQTTFLAFNDAARAGVSLSGTAGAGAYCAFVYDVGNVAESMTYTLTVTHY